jgi:hypothetical protein
MKKGHRMAHPIAAGAYPETHEVNMKQQGEIYDI